MKKLGQFQKYDKNYNQKVIKTIKSDKISVTVLILAQFSRWKNRNYYKNFSQCSVLVQLTTSLDSPQNPNKSSLQTHLVPTSLANLFIFLIDDVINDFAFSSSVTDTYYWPYNRKIPGLRLIVATYWLSASLTITTIYSTIIIFLSFCST